MYIIYLSLYSLISQSIYSYSYIYHAYFQNVTTLIQQWHHHRVTKKPTILMPCAERASSFLITQNSASPCVPNSFNMAKEASANHQKAYMMKELYRRHGFQLTNVHNLLVSQNKLSRLGGHQKPSCHAMVTTTPSDHPRLQRCSEPS